MSRLRVAVIGLGVGEQHLLTYDRDPRCEVVVACDFSEERRREVAARYPHIPFTESADALLTDPAIDVVSIASFDDHHYPQLLAALGAGKHVFVEKPLCQHPAELREIRQAWLEHGGRVKLMSNLVLRAAPAYRWLRERLRSGDLGRLYAFDGDYLYGRLPKITQGWRATIADYSVMAGGGVHLVDLFLWLTGERPATVTAVGNGICTEGTAFRPADYVAAQLQCPSGIVVRITANFGCVHGHQHVVRAFGTTATFLYDDRGARWQTHRDPAPPAEPIAHSPLPAGKGVLLEDFVTAILNDEDLSLETQADFDTVSVCFAVDAALRTGTKVEIEYV